MPRELIFYDSASATFKPTPQSGGIDESTAASVLELNKKAVKTVQLTGTLLSSGWGTGKTPPFTQVLTVSGLTAVSDGFVSVAQSASSDQYKAASEAMLRPVSQGINTISITSEGLKPKINIPIIISVTG